VKNQIEIIATDTAYPMERPLPLNYRNVDVDLIDGESSFTIPSLNVYKINNAKLYEDGSIFTGEGLFRPSIRDAGMLSIYKWWTVMKRDVTFKKIDLPAGNYVSVIDHWGTEYYHWFVENFTRLLRIKKEVSDFTLILSERHRRPHVLTSLSKIGIKDILFLEPKTRVLVPSLYTCDFPGEPDFHRESLIKEVNELFKDQSEPTRKIYISRQKAPKRKIINAKEVEDVLKKYGYETIYAEDLSFEEQVGLFNQTKSLVTLHGAGLTNILWMKPETHVLELRKDRWGLIRETGERENSKFYNTYYHLCLALGVKYSYLSCPSNIPEESARFADLEVDTDQLSNELEKIN
jgi:capsular polysaccharide biosynthesis protein